MKRFYVIVDRDTGEVVKRLCVNCAIEDWQRKIILNDFCAINELSLMHYSLCEI